MKLKNWTSFVLGGLMPNVALPCPAQQFVCTCWTKAFHLSFSLNDSESLFIWQNSHETFKIKCRRHFIPQAWQGSELQYHLFFFISVHLHCFPFYFTQVACTVPNKGSHPADPYFSSAISIKEQKQTTLACSSELHKTLVNGLLCLGQKKLGILLSRDFSCCFWRALS